MLVEPFPVPAQVLMNRAYFGVPFDQLPYIVLTGRDFFVTQQIFRDWRRGVVVVTQC